VTARAHTTEERPIMSRSRSTWRREGGESGQAFVELALVLPVLLLLLLGVIQFGNVFRDYIALTDATRVGARQASVSRSILPATNRIPLVVAKVQRAAVNLNTTNMTVTVTPVKVDGITPGWEESGDVTVYATYPFKINLFGMVIYDGLLQSRTVERVE
jgi:Flp pilus assembly protein TadG